MGALQAGQRGARRDQVERRRGAALPRGSASTRAFGAQRPVHHHRHAVDHHVEEAADQQAQHRAGADEQRGVGGEWFEKFHAYGSKKRRATSKEMGAAFR